MIKPLHDYCLLKKEKEGEKKFGDIILTSKKDDGNIATIIAIGSEVKTNELALNKKVVYKEYSSTSYKENDDEYLLVKEEDILAVID